MDKQENPSPDSENNIEKKIERFQNPAEGFHEMPSESDPDPETPVETGRSSTTSHNAES